MLRDIIKILLLSALLVAAPVLAEMELSQIDGTHLFDDEVQETLKFVSQSHRNINSDLGTSQHFLDQKKLEVGDIETFWIRNIKDKTYEQIDATLEKIGEHCYIFVENGKALKARTLGKIQNEFDNNIYPTCREYFGSEASPGVDGDKHISLLLLDIKDDYKTTGNFIGGYYYPIDGYLQSSIPPHLKSNQREILYLDIYPADPSSTKFLGTIAHEFQHMIHFNHDPHESTWVNESCSQLAPYLCDYGHPPQIKSFMKCPDNSLIAWDKDQILVNYGQVYLWIYYIYNRLVIENNHESRVKFLRRLVASYETGLWGYIEALSSINRGLSRTFNNFCIANFVNNPDLGKGRRFSYDSSLSAFSLPPSEIINTFPAKYLGDINFWSADAIRINMQRSRSELEISFQSDLLTFSEDLYNSFTVALVTSSSNTLKNLPDRISYMETKIGFHGNRPFIEGKMIVDTTRDRDIATLIIISRGPMIEDSEYENQEVTPYTVNITDVGDTVVRDFHDIDIVNEVNNYVRTARNMDYSTEVSINLTLASLNATSDTICSAIIAEYADGKKHTINSINKMIENGDIDASEIRPLLKKIDSIARFYSIPNR